QVAQVVLPELPGGIAHRLENRGDCRCFRRHSERRTGLTDRRQPCTDGQLASNEVGATGGATRLGVVVWDWHALRGKLVAVRRPAGHDALVVGADVEPPDVVSHDEDDVGFLLLRGRGSNDTQYQRYRSEPVLHGS